MLCYSTLLSYSQCANLAISFLSAKANKANQQEMCRFNAVDALWHVVTLPQCLSFSIVRSSMALSPRAAQAGSIARR